MTRDLPQPRPRPSADQKRGPASQQPHLAALGYRLRARIRAIHTSEDWVSWLHLAARLPGYNFSNILLIGAQQPDATLVADDLAWRATGRQINGDEPAIEIFGGNTPEPDSPGHRRRRAPAVANHPTPAPGVIRLWDIAQTVGSPGGQRSGQSRPANPAPSQVWDALTWIARREGFTVEREYCGQSSSAALWDAHQIRVRPDLDDVSAAQALLHQIAHLLLHGRTPPAAQPGSACCRGQRKVEADSASFIVSERFGLDVTGYAFASPAVWAWH